MRIEKEGIHTYVVDSDYENSYYVMTEYPMIKNNMPESFLPLQLREKDGKGQVYYDTTGKMTLEEWSGRGILHYDEIRAILKSMKELYEDLENYILSLDQVIIGKDTIYIDSNKRIQWMYGPKSNDHINRDMEQLFLWLLSNIDYEDTKAARLTHKLYTAAKKEGICKNYIEDCLASENVPDNSNLWKQIDEGTDFSGEEGREDQAQAENDKTIERHRNQGRHHWKKIISAIQIILFLADLILVGYWGYGIFLYGGQWKSNLFFLGLMLILILLGISIYFRMWGDKKDEKMEVDQEADPEKRHKVQKTSQKPKKSIYEELESQWGSGGETVLLSDASIASLPTLYNPDTHQVIPIQVSPFYIGSEDGLNQLSIPNATVSRQHAVLIHGDQDQYYIEDLNSRNGTKVNGKKLLPENIQYIEDGDRIIFSDQLWIFQINDG